jgi:hypothetical protein
MEIQLDLPTSPITEGKLLSALICMEPAERDKAVKTISASWFCDLWNRRLFGILSKHRRRKFGAEMLSELKASDGPLDNSGWWVARLFVERDNSSVSGRPQIWKEYAHVLEKLYSYRIRVLLKLEELKELADVAKTETYPLCDPAERDERTDGRDEGQGPGDFQHGPAVD